MSCPSHLVHTLVFISLLLFFFNLILSVYSRLFSKPHHS